MPVAKNRRLWMLLGVFVCATILVAGCGDDDAATTSAPEGQTTVGSTTTSTSAGTSSSTPTATSGADDETTSKAAGGSATVESVVATAQALLDEKFAANPDPPPEVLGPIEISCDRSGEVKAGDLLACTGTPRTVPGFELDSTGVVFAVLDDAGTTSWATGTDLPSNLDGLNALIRTAPPGLFCRDLADPDSAAEVGFFSAATTTESFGYFLSVVYWFIEGRPDRMDANSNGIPCETVHDPDIVAPIWSGGPV